MKVRVFAKSEFDPIDRATFIRMLSRVLPDASANVSGCWWTPRVHLAVFVHRVDGII